MTHRSSVLGHSPYSRVSPAATESLTHGFIEFIGGPLGRFARPGTQRFWTPLRIVLLCTLATLSIAFVSKANCLQSVGELGHATLNWSGNRQYVSGCYSDIIPLFDADTGTPYPPPYTHDWVTMGSTRFVDQPVLGVFFAWLMSIAARLVMPIVITLGIPVAEVVVYFCLTAITITALWLVAIRFMTEIATNRVWDVVLIACSPLIIAHAFTNWDLLSVAAVIAALRSFARSNPVSAGTWLGVGVCMKLWPVLILIALVLLGVRTRRWTIVGQLLLASVATWLIINLPLALVFGDAWSQHFRTIAAQRWDWQSSFAVVARATNWQGFDSGEQYPWVLNAFSLGLFAVCFLAIVVLTLRVKRQPRVAELCFLIVAAFLFTTKVWSPQYSLWLLPLVVLAVPRWRLVMSWGTVELILWFVQGLHMLGPDNRGIPGFMFDVVLVTRDGLILMMVMAVVQHMRDTIADPITDTHQGYDPLAGPLQMAPHTARPRKPARPPRWLTYFRPDDEELAARGVFTAPVDVPETAGAFEQAPDVPTDVVAVRAGTSRRRARTTQPPHTGRLSRQSQQPQWLASTTSPTRQTPRASRARDVPQAPKIRRISRSHRREHDA